MSFTVEFPLDRGIEAQARPYLRVLRLDRRIASRIPAVPLGIELDRGIDKGASILVKVPGHLAEWRVWRKTSSGLEDAGQ